ncbi:MAG: hypothetical protein R3183_12575, partial [Oleiphilaceae bacterium]|nr:hypothetical protein [Oleiphilaceae bacterium]
TSLVLAGCNAFSVKKTQEELAEYNKQVQVVHESALMPVYLLARETCKYHIKNGTWPHSGSSRTSGSFDYLEVVSSKIESITFNLKVSAVNGTADFTINKLPSAPEATPYSYKLLAHFPGGDLSTHGFFSCANDGLSESELMGYTKKLTSTLNFYNAAADDGRSTTAPLAQKTIELGVKAALCVLLKLEPTQCV